MTAATPPGIAPPQATAAPDGAAPDGAAAVRTVAGAQPAAGAAPLRPMALVCLGEIAWGNSWKRNQSMVFQLARLPLFERVVFVNPRPVWVRDELLAREGSLPVRLRKMFRSIPRTHDHKIRTVGQVHVVPMRQRFPRAAQVEERLFLSLVRLLHGGRPFVLLNNNPDFHPKGVLRQLMADATLRVFDLSDDFEEFWEDPAARANYRASLAYSCTNSEIVLAVNEHVRQKYAVYNLHTHVIPNATNYWNFHRDHYQKVPFLERIRALGGPVLGHTGTINRLRLDYELLESLARSHPQWQFVFVGSADPSFLELAGRLPNVHYHAQVAYHALPDWIHGFDVTIVPFRVNAHTKGNDLLKFNDYLAMGKPIVTTDTGGADKYGDLLCVAAGADQFAACVERSLAESSDELRQRRREHARQNSWEDRARRVQTLLLERLAAGGAPR